MIKLNIPKALHETGKRPKQEDAIYPAKGKATIEDRLYIVCDGMGGYEKGEVASQIVVTSFANSISSSFSKTLDEQSFSKLLAKAYDDLDAIDTNTGQSGKMGTTLTLLSIQGDHAFLAHIGDSRIYHIRRNEEATAIIYKSFDHSFVNELLSAGVITEDEAEVHPRRNVVTRAMQPHQSKRCEATIHITDKLHAGDCFFMCSDGVLESVNDSTLLEVLSNINSTDEEKIKKIGELCQETSKDNYSCYFVSVANVEEEDKQELVESEVDAPIDKSIVTTPPLLKQKDEQKKERVVSSSKIMLIILTIIVLIGIIIYLYQNYDLDLNLFTK